MMTTRPEHELLLRIARRDSGEEQHEDLRRLLSAPLDWVYLISTARTQGLIPLLYRHLITVVGDVPPSHFAALKQESLENCQAVLTLMGRLTEVLKLFNQTDLPVLVFKGPILAELAYGENSLRQAGDVDVLVEIENFQRAKELLESLGFEMVFALTSSQQKAHLKFHCEIQFMRDNGFTVIDLHWTLAPQAFPFALKTKDVFARSRQTSVGGQRFRTFGVEDSILFQCMHGAKHYWSRVEWITSLAETIRSEKDIDWPKLIERARETNSVKMLALGLNLARKLGDVKIPSNVCDEIGFMQPIADATMATIFDKREVEYSSARAIKKNFQIMDRKRDVLAAMFRAVFVPTLSDWQSLSLSPSLQPLYYCYRPFRLLKTYAASLTHRVVHRARSRSAIASQSVEESLTGSLID